MSELSDMRQDIQDLKTMISNHIVETNTYRKERDKVIDAHSDCIWDKDGKPGLQTKIHLLEQSEANRKWTIRAVAGASLGLIVERFFHTFSK